MLNVDLKFFQSAKNFTAVMEESALDQLLLGAHACLDLAEPSVIKVSSVRILSNNVLLFIIILAIDVLSILQKKIDMQSKQREKSMPSSIV